MSPEQAHGETLGAATDIFSLGIVLYELLTRVHPFASPSPIAILHAIAADAAVPPASLKPEIPAAIDELILRMLEKNPRLRPAAAEVAATLSDVGDNPRPPRRRARAGPGRRHTVGTRARAGTLRAAFDSTRDGTVCSSRSRASPASARHGWWRTFCPASPPPANRSIARGRVQRLAGTEAHLPLLEALESVVHTGGGESVGRVLKTLAPSCRADRTRVARRLCRRQRRRGSTPSQERPSAS
jgi:hypothetical protein